MQKKYLRKLFLLSLLAVIFYGCLKDVFEVEIPPETDNFSIADARNWFEANAPSMMAGGLSLRSGTVAPIPILNWDIAKMSRDSEWEVIELPWEYEEGKEIFALAEVWEHALANNTIPKNVIRLVVMQNRKTGDTYGFRMKIAPTLDYLLRSGENIHSNMYLDRSSELSGIVVFYTLEGRFLNGWLYRNGEIVTELTRKSLRSRSDDDDCDDYSWWNCNPNIAFELQEVAVIGGGGGFIWDIDDGPPSRYDGGRQYLYGIDGGGGSGGVNLNPDDGPEVQDRSDCTNRAAENSNSVINALNENISLHPDIPEVRLMIDSLRNYARYSPYEHGLTVQTDGGDFWVLNQNFDRPELPSNFIVSGAANQVEIRADPRTFLTAHTHPEGIKPSPTPGDAIALAGFFNGSAPNIAAAVIFGYGGEEYMIFIDDRTALSMFLGNLYNQDFLQGSGAMFRAGSDWDIAFIQAFSQLRFQGFSPSDAQSFALAYVLDRFNTGMKIYRRGDDGQFKEQQTVRTGANDTNFAPQRCP